MHKKNISNANVKEFLKIQKNGIKLLRIFEKYFFETDFQALEIALFLLFLRHK